MNEFNQEDGLILHDILLCPNCQGALDILNKNTMLQCNSCSNKYPIKDGIYHLMPSADIQQKEEKLFRDQIAQNHLTAPINKIFQTLGRHHCIPVMQKRASDFRQSFSSNCILLDIGGGWGYHWINTTGPVILLIDFSLENLLVAKRLLTAKNRIILLWADASHLPIRSHVINGVWSSQATQCFPPPVMELFISALQRVLRPDHFACEIYNLNDAKLITLANSLGRRCLKKYCQDTGVEIKLTDARSLRDWFKPICQGAQVDIGYSELFFHPNLKFWPPPMLYPEKLERLLIRLLPSLVRIFARQIQINITL
jgi:uncharacterized protein YbaR (Trm112 family)